MAASMLMAKFMPSIAINFRSRSAKVLALSRWVMRLGCGYFWYSLRMSRCFREHERLAADSGR